MGCHVEGIKERRNEIFFVRKPKQRRLEYSGVEETVLAKIKPKEKTAKQSSTKHVNEISDSAVVSRGMACLADVRIPEQPRMMHCVAGFLTHNLNILPRRRVENCKAAVY